MKLEHPLNRIVMRKVFSVFASLLLHFAYKVFISCWVPSNVGIRDNEKADSAAKSALDSSHVNVGVSYADFGKEM